MLRRLIDISRARVLRRARKPSAPVLMTYNVTDRCNARCAMCEIHTWRAAPADELSADDFNVFIKDPLLENLEVIRVTGGEPFLRGDIPQIYQSVASATKCKIFYVTTNGSFPDRTEEFVKSSAGGGPKIHIQVSLDAMTEEHDRLRGVTGIGERAAETLRRLAALKESCDFHAGINQTVMKSTMDQIGPVREFAESLGLGHSLFLGAKFHEGKDLSGERPEDKPLPFAPQDGLTPEEMERFYAEHVLLKSNEAAARGRRGSISAYLRDLSEEYLNEGGRNRALNGLARPAPPCMAMFSHFRLLADGRVVPCSVFRTEVAGNVKEQSYSDIWTGARASEIRGKVLRCKGCWIECDINPSVFYSGDIVSWFILKMVSDLGFRKRYLMLR